MREAVIVMFVVPALVLAGMIVYMLAVFYGPSHTYIPVASVRFDWGSYASDLSFDDFRGHELFADLECNDCRLDVLNGPTDMSDLEPGGGVGFGFWYLASTDELAIFFYGEDDAEVKPIVGNLIRFLMNSAAFEKGFTLIEESSGRIILPSERAAWLSGNGNDGI